MSYELRPYQEKAVQQLRRAIADGKRSALLALATGAGKTIIIASIMRSAWERGHRTIFFAHRRELVKQTQERFAQYGLPSTVLMAGHETDWSVPLVIASQQTWESRREWLDGEYAVVIFDEAHIGVKRQQRIIEDISATNPNVVTLGVTATPMTNSGPGLGSVYETLVQPATMEELVKQGYLVDLEYYMMRPVSWNPEKKIKVNSVGEYDAAAVEEWFKQNAILGDIVQNYADNFMGRKFIVFARTRTMSIWVAEAFGRAGIPVAHIDFSTPDKERRRIIEAYRRGEIIGLSNVDIFSEGFDVSDVDLAIIATPIRSVPRYIQRIGRIMRPSPGKEIATVVDHGGVLQLHGPVTRYQVWALEPARPDRRNPLHALKEVKRETERRCPMCGKTFKAGHKECPHCGYDFYHLPPGYEPPIVPAIMVEYEEAMAMDRLGLRLSCKGMRLPPGVTDLDLWAELLGEYERRKNTEKPWKMGFIQVLYYSATCQCINTVPGWRSVQPKPPSSLVTRVMKRYFLLKRKGYFGWDKFPCWRSVNS